MPRDSLIGQQLDEYRLEALLGQGGMARVYRALDVRLKRWVAIKVIDTPFRTDADYIKRFEREAQAIAQLEHPHIVRLYRYGEANGLLYMAMQYLEGAPLNELLATYRSESGFIEPTAASRIVREVCLALDYAHRRGVIHRDVKPANIILNQQGQAILADFGLALLTQVGTQGEIFGTPHYMAPEQAMSSASAVAQSDLYAVGVILYEMFTGVLPFDAAQPLDIAMQHMTKPPRSPRQIRPELSRKLEAVILKSLAKDPTGRYATGRALSNALDKALEVTPVKTAVPVVGHSLPERVAMSLAKRPLPPLPAAVAKPAPHRASPAAPKRPRRSKTHRRRASHQAVPSPEPVRRRRPSVLTIGLGLAVGLGVIMVAILGWIRFKGWPGGLEELAQQFVPPVGLAQWIDHTVTPTAPAHDVIPLPGPSATPAVPTVTPTATPLLEPQLVADTSRDFSGQPDEAWAYFFSKPDQNNFQPLKFEQRTYGSCWYGQDYIRICQDSGHPGNSADIAWRWTSNVSGQIEVEISARKIDSGGDGVTILAYHNQLNQPIDGWQIGPNDTAGVFRLKFFETEVKQGDTLFFVMKRNSNAQNDHTAFQVQIYLTGATP